MEVMFGNIGQLFGNMEAMFGSIGQLFGNMEVMFGIIGQLFGNMEAMLGNIGQLFGNILTLAQGRDLILSHCAMSAVYLRRCLACCNKGFCLLYGFVYCLNDDSFD